MSFKRRKDGTLIFKDHSDFRPNLTPAQMFQMGIFGGTYFRPIKSNITHKKYKNVWNEYPKSWFRGLDINTQVASPICCPDLNKYKVISGTSLRYWESKGWIKSQDPYGWVQWYCRFYRGRRTVDDDRQIARWKGIASENGRFRKRLVNIIETRNKRYPNKDNFKDKSISPVMRQLLIQWAYDLKKSDLHN